MKLIPQPRFLHQSSAVSAPADMLKPKKCRLTGPETAPVLPVFHYSLVQLLGTFYISAIGRGLSGRPSIHPQKGLKQGAAPNTNQLAQGDRHG